MQRVTFVLAVLATAASLTGCVTRLGDRSVMSNRNMSMPVYKGQRVVGSDCVWDIFGIPTGTPNIEAATDDAMTSDTQAEFLTDVTLSSSGWSALLLGQHCFEVEGTLARAQSSGPPMQVPVIVQGGPM